MLLRENDKLSLLGNKKARVFKKGKTDQELDTSDDLSFLLE